jgi:hypothetical protein
MSGTLSLGLNPSDIVSISLVISNAGIPAINFGAAMAIGYSNVIDVAQRQRVYTTLTQIANDFGTTAPEYVAGSIFFAQNPNGTFYIGRWAKTATSAILHGGLFNAAAQAALITSLSAVTTGSMTITIGGTATPLSPLNFSGVTTMPGIAAIINTALSTHGSCVWNSIYGRFDITAGATGITSTITYAAPTGTGVDESVNLLLTAAGGASLVQGQALETPLAALSILAAYPGYMLGFALNAYADLAVSDYEACAAFIEGTLKTFGITINDANVLASTTTDLAALLAGFAYTRTFTLYCSTNLQAVFGWMGISSTVNFNAQNSTITMKFKTIIGVVPETLTESQYANVKFKFCNVQVYYSNNAALAPVAGFLQEGWMVSGLYFDIRIGADWQANDLQVALFNRLLNSPKVPQTDQGLHVFVTDASASMQRGVNNGNCAPGVWNENILFGTLNPGDVLSTGFYIYMPPVASQSIAQRVSRAAPPMQIAYKLAGATHSASATIYINQ